MGKRSCLLCFALLVGTVMCNMALGDVAWWRFEDSFQSSVNASNLATTAGSTALFSADLPGDPIHDSTGVNLANTKSFRNGTGTSTTVANWSTLNNTISSSGFTIEAFVKLDTGGTFAFDQIIGNLNGAGTAGWNFGLDGTGKLRFGSAQTNDGAYKQVVAPTALTPGVWHHVAVTGNFSDRTGSGAVDFLDVQLYVDYAAVGSTVRFYGSTATGATGVKGPVLVQNSASYTIGSVNPLDGLIDEIRITETPRTTAQFLAADYKPLTATPVFTPAGGSFAESQSVTMTCATSNAQIYYTTDGSTPTTSSTLYSGAVTVDSTMTIKARAFLTGYLPSEIQSQTYTMLNQNVAHWRFESSFQSIFNSSHLATTAGSTALLTVDIPGGPVHDTAASYANAKGYKHGTGTATTVANWSTLNAVLSSGSFTVEAFVKLNPTGDYAFDQIMGNLNGAGTEGWGLGLDGTGKLRFFAAETNSGSGKACVASTALTPGVWHHVAVVGWFYDKTGEGLVDYVDVDLYVDYVKANATTTRYYGTLATGGTGVKGPVTVASTSNYRIGADNPFDGVIDEIRITDAPRTTAQFLVADAKTATATPVLDPAGGSYTSARPVSMTCATSGAQIYYTLDGGDPEYGKLYAGPIVVDHRVTIKAQAFAPGYVPSAIATEAYTVSLPLSQGSTYLLEKGLQVAAVGSVSDWNLWGESNFSTNHLAFPFANQLPPGVLYCQQTSDVNTFPMLPLYWDRLVSIKYKDEQRFRDPNTQQLTGEIAEARTFMTNLRTNYPDVRAMLYTNQWGNQETPADMALYMSQAQPDMLCFDDYPFSLPTPPVGGSPTNYYAYLQKYRLLGLAGNDGTGSRPIPCGLYLDCFKDTTGFVRFPSDSEMRLNQFSAWVFGFKFVDAFIYCSNDLTPPSPQPALFVGTGDSSPTAAFTQIAETNRQSRNLGAALVRLISTDVRMIPGQHGSGAANSTPAGVATGLAGADAYLTAVSATNLGGKNSSLPGDVFVGFFKVLHESFDSSAYTNEKYFMIVNGLSDAAGTVAETSQRIVVDFNFGSSGINSLQRLSRQTGQVETVALTPMGGSVYRLTLDLEGGTGDLFKYNTGAPFVGMESFTFSGWPILTVTPDSQEVTSDAVTTTFDVANGGSGDLTWSAEVVSGGEWLTLSNAGGTNAGTITANFAANTGAAARTATIRITAAGVDGSPKDVTVVQAEGLSLVPGDANGDGKVNFSDYLLLSQNFGTSGIAGEMWGQGDFNSDGTVNFSDYLILSQNFGTGGSVSAEEVAKFKAASADLVADDESGMGKDLGATLPCSLPAMALLAMFGLALYSLSSLREQE